MVWAAVKINTSSIKYFDSFSFRVLWLILVTLSIKLLLEVDDLFLYKSHAGLCTYWWIFSVSNIQLSFKVLIFIFVTTSNILVFKWKLWWELVISSFLIVSMRDRSRNPLFLSREIILVQIVDFAIFSGCILINLCIWSFLELLSFNLLLILLLFRLLPNPTGSWSCVLVHRIGCLV